MSSERPQFAAAVTCIDGRVHETVTDWVKALPRSAGAVPVT